MILFAA
jgi:hypothetical protein